MGRMIEGITVLESTQIVTDSVLNFLVAYGCFLFIMIMCICIGIWRWAVDKIPFKRAQIWIAIGLTAGITIGCLVGKFVLPTPVEYTTILKTEIEDKVTIGELKEYYIITKQEGNYYYLEKREEE
jgi:hypothetical protein